MRSTERGKTVEPLARVAETLLGQWSPVKVGNADGRRHLDRDGAGGLWDRS